MADARLVLEAVNQATVELRDVNRHLLEMARRTEETTRAMQRQRRQSSRVGASFKFLMKRIRGVNRGLIRAAWLFRQFGRAIRGSLRVMNNALEATQRQQLAEVQLGLALSRNTRNVGRQVKEWREYARTLSGISTLADEEILEITKVLAEFGFHGQQLGEATEGVIQRALQVGRAPLDMARILGKFASGATNEVGELGIALEQTGNRAADVQQLLRKMGEGDFLRKMGQLPILQFSKLKNTLGSLNEAFGDFLARTSVFRGFIVFAERQLVKLRGVLGDKDAFQAFNQLFKDLVVTILKFAAVAIPIFVSFVLAIFKVVGFLGDIAAALGATARDIEVIGQKFTESEISKMLLRLTSALHDQQGAAKKDKKAIKELEVAVAAVTEAFRDGGVSADKFFHSLGEGPGVAGAKQRINNLSKVIRGVPDDLGQAARAMGEFEFGLSGLGTIINELIRDIEGAKGLEKVRSGFAAIFKGLGDTGDPKSIREMLGLGGGKLGAALTLDDADFEQIRLDAVLFGQQYATSFHSGFSTFWVDALSQDVGIREAWATLGEQLKDQTVQTMAEGFSKPFLEEIQRMAQSLVKPFLLVGKVIAKALLSPIATVVQTIADAITEAIGGAVKATAEQAAVHAALLKLWVGFATAMAPTVGPLAAAVAIIDPSAPARAAGQVAAAFKLVVGSMLSFGEGGIIHPTAGGRIIRVAEKGESEIVAPVSKAPELLAEAAGIAGGGFGGFGGDVTVIVNGSGVTDPDMLREMIQEGIESVFAGGRI